MKREHKSYSRPKKPFEKSRIEEEAKIKKEFGLKNKKEIWKADAKVKSMREKAKTLISSDEKEQNLLFEKLKKMGLKVNSIGEVLSLTKTDYMNRRLQTLLVKKNLATTLKGARQLIIHQKVLVNGAVVDSPSFIVPIHLEDKLQIKEKKLKAKKGEQPIEE